MAPRPCPTPGDVRDALERHVLRDLSSLLSPGDRRDAPVLVPLLWDPEPVAVVTVRAAHLRLHAGEVCFPGGSPEPGDADAFATAVREAREELGIGGARPLGRLSAVPVFASPYRLVPHVADLAPGPLHPTDGEVARVLKLPIRAVLEEPHLDGVPFVAAGEPLLSPVFLPEGHRMYGATAHVFHELLEVMAPLYGLPVPPLRPGRFDWADLFARRGARDPGPERR